MPDKVVAIYYRRQIDLTLQIPGVRHWSLPMNTSRFKIYKGSKNRVEVVVRNSDRKPIDLGAATLVITIADPETGQVVLQKPLIVIDPLQGSAILVLDRFDTDDWLLGFYRYSIVYQASDLSQSILYVDQDQSGYGYFELLEGPVIGPADSLVCTNFTPGAISNLNTNYYYSDIFPANAQVNNHDFGVMTLAMYMTNWTGDIFVQGCVEESPPVNDTLWFPIATNGSNSIHVERFSGIYPVTVEASLRWLRTLYLADSMNAGTFDKVIFRV
jgi:hypothetical protein